MNPPTIVVIVISLLIGGCATPSRYEWNQYDQRLYDFYKSPAAADEFVTTMEAHVRSLETTGKKPAPGLYAELGTFYLKRGDSLNAAQYYSKEMNAWPESKAFMTSLIANIEKPSTGEKK